MKYWYEHFKGVNPQVVSFVLEGDAELFNEWTIPPPPPPR